MLPASTSTAETASSPAPAGYFAEDIRRQPSHPTLQENAPAPRLTALQRIDRARARRSEQRAARDDRQRVRDEKWFERNRAALIEAGADPDCTMIHAAVWRACWAIVDDRSGRAAWYELRKLPASYRGALWRAFAGRTWASSRARRLVALAVGLYQIRRAARKKSRWRHFIAGLPREALVTLLREPSTNHTPSVSGLSGWHRDHANLENGQLGWLRTLEQVGIVYRMQERQCAEDPTCNQYWLLDSHSPYTNDDQRRFAFELARDSIFVERPDGARAPPLTRYSD